jgi:hypothetical protein
MACAKLNVVFAALFVAWGAALLVYGLLHNAVSIFGVLLVAAGMWALITRLQARS